jgi:hypothetical protein
VRGRPGRLDNHDPRHWFVRLPACVRRRVDRHHSREAGGKQHPCDHEERLNGGSLGAARQLIHDDAFRR